jgi:hypothetical protein
VTRRNENENQIDEHIRERPPTDVTGSTITMLNDTCGNLIQLTQLARY